MSKQGFSYLGDDLCEYIDHSLVDDYTVANNEASYIGKYSIGNNEIVLDHVRGFPIILHELNYVGLLHYYRKEVNEDEVQTFSFYFENNQELVPIFSDTGKIAEIYKKLIKMGIFVYHCDFVKGPNHEIYLHIPDLLIKYTSVNRSKIVSTLFMDDEDGSMFHSIPDGIDYELLRSMIWETGIDEISNLIGNNLTINE